MPPFDSWLGLLAAAIVGAVVIAALVAVLLNVRKSGHLPNRSAHDALTNARAEFRKVFQSQRESEARLLQSIARAGFGAWSVDLLTGDSWRSPQYDVIFGYTEPLPQWTLRMFLDHVIEEDRALVEKSLQDAHASAGDSGAMSVEFECRIRRADGAIRWIQAQGARETKGDTNSIMFGLVHDITPRKQAEAQLGQSGSRLHEKERRLAEAQQIAQVGSWDVDFATGKLSGSDEFFRILGLQPGEFHGTFRDLQQRVHPDDRALVKQTIRDSRQSLHPYVFEHRIVQPDGEIRHIEAQGRVILDRDGKPIGMAGTKRDITDRQAAEDQLHRLAHYDPLTGLPNRRLFYQSLYKEVEVAKEKEWYVALLYVDLDRFKYVNDTFGHSTGDELLRQVAERILSCTRVRDTVGRLGGDEFGIIAVTPSDPGDAATMAEKLIHEMQEPFALAGHDVVVTPSIGMGLCPADATDTETLIKFADMAMYHAKAAGRNAYRYYTPSMNLRAREKLQLEAALRKAIARDEFVLHYQPEIDIGSGEWTGAEALLRWNRPGHGLMAPAHFVPALEESGLIIPVGQWVIDTACQQLGRWRDAGIGGITLSVNVSAKQVQPVGLRRGVDGAGDGSNGQSPSYDGEEICEHVERCLRQYSIAPDRLELELTETALMSHAENTIEMLSRLKELGVHILVDDFGTGYSSLAYLKRFPIDTLKIDRGFVGDLLSDPEDRAIVKAIISLAHSLNLQVIAEGVETRDQLEFLQVERCDRAQGFYIAHPMPGDQLLKLFQANGHGPSRSFEQRQSSLFRSAAPPGPAGPLTPPVTPRLH